MFSFQIVLTTDINQNGAPCSVLPNRPISGATNDAKSVFPCQVSPQKHHYIKITVILEKSRFLPLDLGAMVASEEIPIVFFFFFEP